MKKQKDRQKGRVTHPQNWDPDTSSQSDGIVDSDPLKLGRAGDRLFIRNRGLEIAIGLAQGDGRLGLLEDDLVDGGQGGRCWTTNMHEGNPEIDVLVDLGKDVSEPSPDLLEISADLSEVLENNTVLFAEKNKKIGANKYKENADFA